MKLVASKNSPNSIDQVLESSKPLVVDIDGTIAKRDIFLSLLIQKLIQKPWLAVPLLRKILSGRLALLKTELAEEREFDWDSHPKNEELIEIIAEQSRRGRKVYLCSGAADKHVKIISRGLGFISEAWGTSDSTNLTGKNKASKLTQIFGLHGFDYIGDSSKDRHVALVSHRTAILRPRVHLASIFEQLRPRHWIKNLLVFVPIITAHEITNFAKLTPTFAAFLVLSLVASATYIFNDLGDLENDTNHREKRLRPLASGKMGLGTGTLILMGLIFFSITLGLLFLSPIGMVGIAGYAFLSITYSIFLKKILVLDVIFIALLFVYRIVLGFFVADLAVSPWLVIFGFFIFLSLAMSKRYTELLFSGNNRLPGRAYTFDDAVLVGQSGVVSGFSAIIVFSIYVNSPQVLGLYSRPEVLWLGVPTFAYWVIHLWMQTNRNRTGHDPLVWAVKDPRSLIVAVITAIIMYLAI